MNDSTLPPPRLIRISEVVRLTAVSRSQIYSLISQGRFPRPVRVSTRSARFVLVEVEGWIADRIDESRRPKARRP